jgi:malate dehydrogenase (quinone)
MTTNPNHIVLIGAGIMSATIGILLKELEPTITITIYERLEDVALESSDAMNNAGTGHAAFCELNYTPQLEDGTIDISKALKICSSFEMSKSFWSYLVKENYFETPETFINNIPHISLVWGDDDVAFLKKRFTAMQAHPLFNEMEYSENWNTLYNWMPLAMHFRNQNLKVAATKMHIGTDVNFGQLTRTLLQHLKSLPNVNIHLQHEVRDIEKQVDASWKIKIKDLSKDESFYNVADFVFIGAGGGTLPLLEKGNIEEAEGYGGFPVSGQWLVCKNENITTIHNAKVYGKASVGAPPMSVPHLDTRMIDGKKQLLFGPFAGFSTKFLKNGSYFDLPLSIDIHNIIPMLSAGWHNMSLTKYLIDQVSLSHKERMDALREYFPEAKDTDWELVQAGQRVQVIKKDKEQGGILEFGTEIITTADGSLSALLGASPGASTAVYIMLQILKKCFAQQMENPEWKNKLLQVIPMMNTTVDSNFEQWLIWRKESNHTLHLDD